MKRIQQLRELHQDACGPEAWRPEGTDQHGWRVLMEDDRSTIVAQITGALQNQTSQADAELIAAMRNTLPALLDVAEWASGFLVSSAGLTDESLDRLTDALARLEEQ